MAIHFLIRCPITKVVKVPQGWLDPSKPSLEPRNTLEIICV